MKVRNKFDKKHTKELPEKIKKELKKVFKEEQLKIGEDDKVGGNVLMLFSVN